MIKLPLRIFSVVIFTITLSVYTLCFAQEPDNKAKTTPEPAISIFEDMDAGRIQEASRVKEEFKEQAKSLFAREPLDWDWATIEYLSRWIVTIPEIIPEIVQRIHEQSRILGIIGSLLIVIFLLVGFYSILIQKRLMLRIEKWIEPFQNKLPERNKPRRRVRSALYFSMFDKLKKAGIEIPFPQRDIHIRSTVSFSHGEETRSLLLDTGSVGKDS